MKYCELIASHYQANWSNPGEERLWHLGPLHELPSGFCVLEFSPSQTRSMWTYATCCMSEPTDAIRIEIHLFAPKQDERHVELLTAMAHYNRTKAQLGLGDTVNFGRPWLEGSKCSFGLISLPYLDGPDLEYLHLPSADQCTRFLWLLPITEAELDYKQQFGVEALEQKFDEEQVDYLSASRLSVI
jgi:hypothetical protein